MCVCDCVSISLWNQAKSRVGRGVFFKPILFSVCIHRQTTLPDTGSWPRDKIAFRASQSACDRYLSSSLYVLSLNREETEMEMIRLPAEISSRNDRAVSIWWSVKSILPDVTQRPAPWGKSRWSSGVNDGQVLPKLEKKSGYDSISLDGVFHLWPTSPYWRNKLYSSKCYAPAIKIILLPNNQFKEALKEGKMLLFSNSLFFLTRFSCRHPLRRNKEWENKSRTNDPVQFEDGKEKHKKSRW